MPEDYRDLMAAAATAAGLAPPAVVQPQDRNVKLNGLNFHYLDWGNERLPHVVLLHGGGLTAHTWDMAALLLRDRYHLVALDQRGHGDTDWTPEVSDDTQRLMVEDVRAFLDFLGYERLALVGMSMGGMNSIRYAARYPQRLAALVIVDVGPEIMLEGALELEQFHRDTETLDRFEDFLERAIKFNPLRSPDHLRYSLTHALKRTPDGRWTWKQDRRRRPELDEAAVRAARQRAGEELWQDVRKIRVPTLLMRGEVSKILSAEAAERTVAAMADARLVAIPRAGHTVQGDNPADFAGQLDSFLTRVVGAATG